MNTPQSSFPWRKIVLLLALSLPLEADQPSKGQAHLGKVQTTAEVLAATATTDWRQLDAERSLYLQFEHGTVVIELAPAFAPEHVRNILTLVRERYFDGLAVVRSQDNYVAQWGDPESEEGSQKTLGKALTNLDAELERPMNGLNFTALADTDVYAPQVGFIAGFPAAHDPTSDRVWLIHCYGMVGVGRDTDPRSGNGSSLYAVIGHAPRHLDRNITLVGRVVAGMEILSRFPRGNGPLGFYDSSQEMPKIESVRIGSEIPAAERLQLELLDTDSAIFEKYVASRRHRTETWFLHTVGTVEVCNIPLVTRPIETEHDS